MINHPQLSKVDIVYRSALGLIIRKHKFFRNGWGDVNLLKKLELEHEGVFKYSRLPKNFRYFNKPGVKWGTKSSDGVCITCEGTFESPLHHLLPEESKGVNFQLILPKKPQFDTSTVPICFLLPPTADHTFALRKHFMAIPLAREGIGSLLLESPLYGKRKPKDQVRSHLLHVTDLVLMGAALLAETNSLMNWLTDEGHKYFAVSGPSMGGYMSALIGALSEFPLAVVPCLAPHFAAPVFCDGALSSAVDWDVLISQLPSHLPKTKEGAVEYMGQVLEITNLSKLPIPRYPGASIHVSALYDAYIPLSARILYKHWTDSEIRWIESGHVGSLFFHSQTFVRAIKDALSKLYELQKM